MKLEFEASPKLPVVILPAAFPNYTDIKAKFQTAEVRPSITFSSPYTHLLPAKPTVLPITDISV